MARTSSAPVKPLVSRGYGKIVGLTLLAIVIGCALMGYEVFVEYGGEMTAKRAPKVTIGSLPPAALSAAPAPAPGPGPGPVVPPVPPGGQ